jgi:transposase
VQPMTAPDPLASLNPAALLALVVELPRQNAERQQQVAALTAGHEALRAEIEPLKRGGKRQAAPLSKGTREPAPKCPGRKPGAGPFRDREVPPPEAVSEPPVEVPVTLDACPTCGGPREEARIDCAYTTEWPERPRPKGTQSRVPVCRGTVCGTQVRGQPPEVAPDQYGATAHRVGARVRAAAHALH